MVQATSIAKEVAPYRHAKLSAIRHRNVTGRPLACPHRYAQQLQRTSAPNPLAIESRGKYRACPTAMPAVSSPQSA